MADSTIHECEEMLRFRVHWYLNEQPWGVELKNTLRKLELEGCSAYMVGGFLRDLMLDGQSANPRDIDIVFDRISADKVEFLFWNQPKRKNRFGGMRINFGDCPLDIWSLEDTWAFRNKKVHQIEFSAFPETTFLNVDAIAFRWRHNSEAEIFSKGFFEGLLTQTLEINLEDNPFPETCIVRSLIIASALNFKIGPKLAAYISRRSKDVCLKELRRIQNAHYGSVRLDGDDFREYFDAIGAQLGRDKKAAVSLPGQQLKLEDKPTKKNKRKKTFNAWISEIAEAFFVYTKPVRQLKKKFAKTSPTINVLNVHPQWITKIPD